VAGSQPKTEGVQKNPKREWAPDNVRAVPTCLLVRLYRKDWDVGPRSRFGFFWTPSVFARDGISMPASQAIFERKLPLIFTIRRALVFRRFPSETARARGQRRFAPSR